MLTGHQILKASTNHPLIFRLGAIADALQAITGANPVVVISKNGGAFASPTGSVSEIGQGWYKLTPSSADTNTLGPLILKATATLAGISETFFQVVARDPDQVSIATDSQGRVAVQPGSFTVSGYATGMSPAEQVKIATDASGNVTITPAALKAITVYTDSTGKTLNLLDAINALITRPASHSNVSGSFPRTINVNGPNLATASGRGAWSIQVTEDRTTVAVYTPPG